MIVKTLSINLYVKTSEVSVRVSAKLVNRKYNKTTWINNEINKP